MTKLTDESSIPALLREMTVEEKIDLLIGRSSFSTAEMPKYGIPSLIYLDGATGVNMLQYVCELLAEEIRREKKEKKNEGQPDDGPADTGVESSNESGAGAMAFVKYIVSDTPLPETLPERFRELVLKLRPAVRALRPEGEEPGCFPPGMLLGAAWDPDVVYQVGEAVAREAMAYKIDVLLGTPNTNIQRDPKNGRVFESFSEDPYLSRRMAPAFSRGVQDQGMIADVKHFAANNQETLRAGIDEHIDERTLREIYLPGFEATVKEGKVQTVMSAYNSINGVPCAQNRWLLTEVLKEEWGFDGQVVSDWGAVYDQVEALNAGNDLDMPGPRGKDKLYQAVSDGTVSMERLDDAVSRMLNIVLKSPKFRGRTYQTIDTELSRNAAYRAASEGITLLKNDGLLPLKRGTKVALYGPLSQRFMDSGSGSAQVDTSKTTSLVTETARYTDAVLTDRMEPETEVVIITSGASGQEGSDRPAMDFDPADKELLQSALREAKEAGKKTVVILNVAGPVELEAFLEDIDALLCVFFPGMEGARAAADIMFGTVSPSGKLPITFPKKYRDTPTAFNFPGEYGHVNYGEGIFVGYRYYDFKGIEPLYPFGYGLSYSRFSIRDAVVQNVQKTYGNESSEPLRVTVTVKNEGNMKAKEVVQLYVHARKSTLLRPDKELKGFAKVELEPGEERKVTLELRPRDFASYDTRLHDWACEPGIYDLLIGNSSRNITAQAEVELTGADPYGLSLYTPISRIAAREDAVAVCEEILGSVFDREKLKSNVIYFGETPLGEYMERYVSGVDKSSDIWKESMAKIKEKLAMLPEY
ncbi:hypothetical protein B5F07_09170 [Lachnoclostridium sp. An169]|uniref:glycoside hydrolase family 3 N-terminal domain-containing protein n=1 Tax=Lachnoclostridium sp. An169 TaxID=1965569 RepID=UPI000B3A0B72|nr:glycoside hydrolase family 3 N-terminal domain-containing protein [Lachnoclostridium sp. An169]OUP84009.1 hypothetical protein B5F07_09170 [Lachnoclostridium sp. An169]